MNLPLNRDDPHPHGEVQQVAPGIRRVICHNPGPFTFRGTNSWIIGGGRSTAVLDPGPVDTAHLAAILSATAGETITHILVSHTHRDHSPGARALQAATGAATYGYGPHATPPDQGGEGGDQDFDPDVRLADGATVEGDDWRLTALFTPGHCGNHLAFALEGTGALFSADHVMGWSTSVVIPPDGDMGDYMASLEKLMARDDLRYHSAHGAAIEKPKQLVRGMIGHRRQRENQILRLLGESARPVSGFIPEMYKGLDERLIGAAEMSVTAHLLDLEKRGATRRDGDVWRMA